MHKEFADALKHAQKSNVKIIAVNCKVTKNSIEIDSFINTEV